MLGNSRNKVGSSRLDRKRILKHGDNDGEGVDLDNHSEDEDYDLMALKQLSIRHRVSTVRGKRETAVKHSAGCN
ncbi:hypothetical protein Tco_0856823 [Tanacetum coccineum]|uniref:Uncharacterized protein n=1 Tax=Tanacetum coccineum TaxID=301880 RepID=A0ABQ5B8E4_9ASTR